MARFPASENDCRRHNGDKTMKDIIEDGNIILTPHPEGFHINVIVSSKDGLDSYLLTDDSARDILEVKGAKEEWRRTLSPYKNLRLPSDKALAEFAKRADRDKASMMAKLTQEMRQ